MLSTRQPILVSVITPFLNAEKYLEEAIESVIAQTYPHWELILMDDGSTDRSTEIAQRYCAAYPEKIFYLCHENHVNRGGSASRNVAFRKARGQYIAYVDADDIFLPNKLKDQVEILNSQPTAGSLYSSTEYWYSWTGNDEDKTKDWVWKEFGFSPNTLVQPPQLLISYLRNGGTVPCIGSFLIRREAIEAVGGWEETFTNIYTDQGFHARFCLRWPVYIAEGCWDKYRQHADSCCHTVERENRAFQARRKYLVWLESFLRQQGVSRDSQLWQVFMEAYQPYKYPIITKAKRLFDQGYKRCRKLISLILHPYRFVYALQRRFQR